MDAFSMELLFALGGAVVVAFGSVLVFLEGMIGPQT